MTVQQGVLLGVRSFTCSVAKPPAHKLLDTRVGVSLICIEMLLCSLGHKLC